MDMTKEMLEKLSEIQTAEELTAAAKEYGLDLTEEEAKKILDKQEGELSDDELEGVSGGGCWKCESHEIDPDRRR